MAKMYMYFGWKKMGGLCEKRFRGIERLAENESEGLVRGGGRETG